jgi:hypothetical protein
MRRLATASLLGSMLLFGIADTAAAKGDAMAALDAPIPPDADPGTELQVGWRAWMPDGTSEWPFTGSPVFMRLISADGTSSTEAFGRENPEGSGHYLATIQVPAGGVGLVEVGLFGETCVHGACSRSDILFDLPEERRVPMAAAPVIVDPPVPAVPAPEPMPAAQATPPDNVPTALVIVAGAVALALLLGLLGRARATSGPAGVAAPAHAGLRRIVRDA